jgi:hypothetical protein
VTKVFVVPVICREDYDAFRRDVGSTLANTYEEWVNLLSKEVAEARGSGKTVVEAKVNYDEFRRYCSTTGKKSNLQPIGR